jgi:hypothetical protein
VFFWNEAAIQSLGISTNRRGTYYRSGGRFKGIQFDAARLAKRGWNADKIIEYIESKIDFSSQQPEGCSRDKSEVRSVVNHFVSRNRAEKTQGFNSESLD